MRNRIRGWRIRCTFLLTAITLSLLEGNVLVTSFVPESSFLSSTFHDSPAGTTRSLLQSTPNHYTGSEGNRNSRSSVSKSLPSKRNDQLIRVIDSILYFGQDSGQSSQQQQQEAPAPQVIQALRDLKSARTSSHIQRAGKLLTENNLVDQASRPIQERLLKVLALSGLLHEATVLLNRLLDQGYLPSYISYTAFFSVLREAGKVNQLGQSLERLAQVSQQQGRSIHIMAFNLYLAALCDETTPSSLETASSLVLHSEPTDEQFGVPLDLTSYNTVLNGAAKLGNETLVNAVWDSMMMKSKTIRPDVRSYNARLLATDSYAKRLDIWHEMKTTRGTLSPDRYTIDLLLLPLLQDGPESFQRQEEFRGILKAFVARHPERVVKDALAAYLTRLVQNQKLDFAQSIFDEYVVYAWEEASSLEPPYRRSDTRLCNVMLEGYRKHASHAKVSAESIAEALRWEEEEGMDTKHMQQQINKFQQQEDSARTKAQSVFQWMQQAGIPVDAYTLTSMMGLCASTNDLIELLLHPSCSAEMSPAVIRCAITISGELGDPGLACSLFDLYSSPSDSSSNRLWNVLLGALAEVAEKGNPIISLQSTAATALFNRQVEEASLENSGEHEGCNLSQRLQGMTCTQASRELLHLMTNSDISWAPPPDAQTFCVVAAALQYDADGGPDLAMSLFRNATDQGIPADGRFVNAIFRCFGDDIKQAIAYWKSEIRRECSVFESRSRDPSLTAKRPPNKNLIAAYNGLLHVSGRAQRPDVGLRLVYAMNREGIEPNDVSLNNYKAGKRLCNCRADRLSSEESPKRGFIFASRSFAGRDIPQLSLPKLNMMKQYENLLYVECTKYNQYDKHMSKDQRVRIIV